MKARYLTFFSYIGTSFRASEKLWIKEGRNYPDPDSIQGLMEIALKRLKSLNYPAVTLSSRTDGGVHALQTSAHVDLDRYGTGIYDPNYITYELNKFFFKHEKSIFVKKCIRVRDNFSARYNAISRTYLYRLAVLKKDAVLPENTNLASYIPVEEWKRCYFMRLSDFDIEKFREGAKYLVGYHDFTTFKKFDKLKQYKHNRREIKAITVRAGRPVVTGYGSQDHVFDYWDVEIKGRAFVHNQIRRMIGTLNSVATGKLPAEEIKVMLQVPSKHSWHTSIQTAPADGLYLCNVEYDPRDLMYDPDSSEKKEEKLQNQKNKLKETETVITRADGKRYIERNDTVQDITPHTYGFIVDTKPDDTPVLITDHFYIGSQDCTSSIVLQTYNIKHVLSLGINIENSIDKRFINCLDLPETDIKDVLRDSLPYIRNSVESKENVLVHCNAGVSRTSMVAIGYLMQFEMMAYEDAYSLVKSKRPAIHPNDGFRKQLKAMKPGKLI